MGRAHLRKIVARSGWACCLALLLTASGASTAAPRKGPYLRWDLEDVPSTAGAEHHLCEAVSVSWLDARDRVRWTAALPKRMRDADGGVCECRRADDGLPCPSELGDYRARPRESEPPFVVGVLRGREVLAVADLSGVLFLDLRSGRTLMDWAAPGDAQRPRLYVDEGTFTLGGAHACSGVFRRGRTLARCGTRLVYFNGSAVALLQLQPPWLEAAARVESEHVLPSAPAKPRARIPVGEHVFALEGIVYLR